MAKESQSEEEAKGTVRSDVVVRVLMATAIQYGVSIKQDTDTGDIYLVKDGIPEVYALPPNVPRRMLQRLSRKYAVRLEFFYHPEMCVEGPSTKH
jgi:hypothetical protein